MILAPHSSISFVKSLCFSLLAGASLLCSSSARAEWPTDYLDPYILGGGTNTRAGDIMAAPGGGVIVVHDDYTTSVRRTMDYKFNDAGDQLFTNPKLRLRPELATSHKIMRPLDTSDSFGLWSQYAKNDIDDNSSTIQKQHVDLTGFWSGTFYMYDSSYEGALITGNNVPCYIISKNDETIRLSIGNHDHEIPRDLGERVSDFSLASPGSSQIVFSYTREDRQPGTPREVWTVYGYEISDAIYYGSYPAYDGTGQDQFNSSVIELGDTNLMLTWLQTLDGTTSLYVKSIQYNATQLSSPRKTVDNVVDYMATTSTLGIPVFAAIIRDEASEVPVDTLIGGLINPGNGGTATITVVSGPDVKVKDLRQLANGDFRLTYSIFEGGTNLLKVRGISGVTAGTLWETTVADLGTANDDIIEAYPNTFVDSNDDNVLYILARYDQPGTANSLFQTIRLRPDGTMGPN